MEFVVPQFIERKTRIAWFFTFKSLVLIVGAGAICTFLFFVLSNKGIWLVLTIFIMGGAFALAFLKINRTPLPIYLKNLFLFLLTPKILLWKKKMVQVKIFKEKEEIKTTEEKEKEPLLEIAHRSHLRKLATDLETNKNYFAKNR